MVFVEAGAERAVVLLGAVRDANATEATLLLTPELASSVARLLRHVEWARAHVYLLTATAAAAATDAQTAFTLNCCCCCCFQIQFVSIIKK